jgi:D-alanine--poly(phosphoribitol) ligase subunit 1
MSLFFNEILKQFLSSTSKFGNRNAFCINNHFYSYNEFADTISAVRILLQQEDITGKNIGLVANDDLVTYASIFAIWLEGAAYVPLHPKEPSERSIEIIQHAHVPIILDSGKHSKFHYLFVKLLKSNKLKSSKTNLLPRKVPDDLLAYILFTSGSTGRPKGVPISRKNLSTFIKSFLQTGIQIDENDRCLQCFDLTFDVSLQSFLVPLLKGACTYTVPIDQIKYSYVYSLLEDHHLTFSVMPSSMIRYLRPYFNEIDLPDLRYNILTAEASPVDLISEWSNCIPNAEIYNFYGPTEATIYCTYYKFNRDGYNKQLNGMISIGKAMPGIHTMIIDDGQGIPVKSEKGELCICGSQLTHGYLNHSEENRKPFFLDYKGRRFYRTGDICFKDSDGDIMLSGRTDSQVKVNGFRIELGEIEFHARNSLNGQNVVAVAFCNKTGNNEVALFVEGELKNKHDLIMQLKIKMPYYMVPTKILSHPKFPLNANGKTDRKVLLNLLLNKHPGS